MFTLHSTIKHKSIMIWRMTSRSFIPIQDTYLALSGLFLYIFDSNSYCSLSIWTAHKYMAENSLVVCTITGLYMLSIFTFRLSTHFYSIELIKYWKVLAFEYTWKRLLWLDLEEDRLWSWNIIHFCKIHDNME